MLAPHLMRRKSNCLHFGLVVFFLGRFFGGVKTNFPSDPFDAARTCPYVCDRSCLYCTTSRQIDTYGGVQGIPVMI